MMEEHSPSGCPRCEARRVWVLLRFIRIYCMSFLVKDRRPPEAGGRRAVAFFGSFATGLHRRACRSIMVCAFVLQGPQCHAHIWDLVPSKEMSHTNPNVSLIFSQLSISHDPLGSTRTTTTPTIRRRLRQFRTRGEADGNEKEASRWPEKEGLASFRLCRSLRSVIHPIGFMD